MPPVIGYIRGRPVYQIAGGDNVSVTAGSGVTVGTDSRSIGGSTVEVQRVAPHGAPSFTVGQVTVSNTTTAITSTTDTRHSITLVNRQLTSVWIANAPASVATGFRLDPGDSVQIFTSAPVHAIASTTYTSSGDDKVHYVLEQD